jgi:uncharacterized protein YjgD (DUF1641 family)
MNEKNTQNQIDDMNRKLDLILEEIELQKRHRREMEDLKDDLMRVGKDIYNTTVEELEEVHDYIETGDMLYLFKKLLRNINNITKTFEIMESTKDFVEDFSPISRELAIDFMNKMDEFDRKGYFDFMRELNKGLDNVVESFSVEDVKALGDNLVTILNTIKSLTQPDMLQAVNNAVAVYKNMDIEIKEDVSLMSLIREMNNPETRKGLAFAIRFLKNLSTQNENKLTKVNTTQTN